MISLTSRLPRSGIRAGSLDPPVTVPNLAITLAHGDLTPELAGSLNEAHVQAWDIETSGLDWRVDRIGTCQVYSDVSGCVVVRFSEARPDRLLDILSNPSLKKVFHHAPFDLRFITSRWGVAPRNISDTKVASKLLTPSDPNEAHSLKALLSRYLGVSINKDQQVSDWLSADLTRDQLDYAATDVRYLLPLLNRLERELQHSGLKELFSECVAFLPTQVALDIGGYPDIFRH